MAIETAVQRGNNVYVYGERNRQLAVLPAGNVQKGDGLQGYTTGAVSIRRGSFVYTYDEKGRRLSTVPAR